MSRKKLWVGLLCAFLFLTLVGEIFAQEQPERPTQKRPRRWPWKGPEIGSVIQDFELPVLEDGTFRLSEKKGRIIIIELGACT